MTYTGSLNTRIEIIAEFAFIIAMKLLYYEDGGLVSGGSKRSKPAKFIRNVMKKTTPTCRVIAKRAKKVIFSCFKGISLTNSERVVLNIGPAKTRDMRKLFKDCGRVLKLSIYLEETADIVGDVRYSPFQEDTIDFLFIIAVLEHVDDPVKAVMDIHKSLKPGGKVYAEIPILQVL